MVFPPHAKYSRSVRRAVSLVRVTPLRRRPWLPGSRHMRPLSTRRGINADAPRTDTRETHEHETAFRKGKPVARRGRKVTGLIEPAGLPKKGGGSEAGGSPCVSYAAT